jgi:hypothetical protein
MSAADLHVEVQGGDIVVTLPYTHYTVTYYKSANSPQLLAKRFPGKDDPHAPMTHAELLAHWKLANDKARELGWIV